MEKSNSETLYILLHHLSKLLSFLWFLIRNMDPYLLIVITAKKDYFNTMSYVRAFCLSFIRHILYKCLSHLIALCIFNSIKEQYILF